MDNTETEPMSPEVAVMVLTSDDPPSMQLTMEAVTALARLVDSRVPQFVDIADENGMPKCWHFVGYRPGAAALGQHRPDALNEADAPQYQGIVFADGTVAMRWLTARRSVSVWESFEEMFAVHGHPEYGTEIRWVGEAPADALAVIAQVQAEYQAAKREATAQRPDPALREIVAEVHAEHAGFASVAEAAEAGVLDEFLNRHGGDGRGDQ